MSQVSRHSSGTEPTTLRQRLRKFVRPAGDWPMPINPASIEHERRRAEARQNRVADAITTLRGLDAVRLHPRGLVRRRGS